MAPSFLITNIHMTRNDFFRNVVNHKSLYLSHKNFNLVSQAICDFGALNTGRGANGRVLPRVGARRRGTNPRCVGISWWPTTRACRKRLAYSQWWAMWDPKKMEKEGRNKFEKEKLSQTEPGGVLKNLR